MNELLSASDVTDGAARLRALAAAFPGIECAACAKATTHLTGAFVAGCKGCAARAVSRGPNYRRVRDAGWLDRKYLGELRQMGVTHDQVKAAAAADFEQRKQR